MPNHEKLQDIGAGEQITAKYLTKTTRAVNENSRAIRAPREVLQVAEDLQNSGGGGFANEVFSGAVTESTQTATDSNGDTIDLKRVDTIVCTETTTGRTMTLNITYP